jgi:hypothetical protein
MLKNDRIFSRLRAFAGRCTLPALTLLAIVLTVTTIACTPAAETERKNPPTDDSRAGDEGAEREKPAAMPKPSDYQRIARLFGESLLAGNYSAAYQLTSGRLHRRMSLEKFSEACQQAAQQFGEAMQLGKVVIDRTDGLDGSAASRQFGFPAEIPDDDRLAWAHCAMALDVDGDEILRCYDCWMLVENDGGKARIGHFSFVACQ